MRRERNRVYRRPHRMRNFLLVLVLMAITAGATLVVVSYTGLSVSSRTTSFSLKNIGELATQAGYFTNVQTISSDREILGVSIPFTHNKYVFSYDGVIKAGIDFSKIELSVDEIRRIITVKLPEAVILSSEIDENSMRVYDEQKSVFNPLKLNMVNVSLITLKNEVTETAVNNGILENALSNAKTLVTGFVAGMYDLNTYQLTFE